jgi:hypothetical protein
MGKRELLLIVAFVVVGAVVYQATAPPSGSDDSGLSVSRMLDAFKRHLRGNRASLELTTRSTLPLDPEIEELRVTGFAQVLEITGEDRADLQSTLLVHSAAYDEQEAKQYGDRTVLLTDRAGASLILRVDYPREGRQRAELTLRIPAHLQVRVESRTDKLVITNVAGVELSGTEDEATIRKIDGRVSADHRSGPVTIEDVEALKFHGRGTELTAKGVHGDATLVMEGGGGLTASGISGAIELESRNTDVNLAKLDDTTGPIRINISGASARLSGLRSDTRVDGRRSGMEIAMSGAAPLAIYNDGDDVTLTPPPAGYRLDVIAIDGTITPDSVLRELGLQPPAGGDHGDQRESRVSGPVNGGGPTITVRVTRGDLILKR